MSKQKRFEVSETFETVTNLVPAFLGVALSAITFVIFHDAVFSVIVATIGASLSLYFATAHISRHAQKTARVAMDWKEIRGTVRDIDDPTSTMIRGKLSRHSRPEIFVNNRGVHPVKAAAKNFVRSHEGRALG